MKKVVVGIIACLIVGQYARAAPAASFQVLEPSPIIVRGVLDDITSEWSALVRVQAGAQPVSAIVLLPTDLLAANNATTRIERSNVLLQNAESLAANEIRDVRLVVRGVPQVGTYTGTIQLLAQGEPITSAVTLPMRVEITAKESITPVDTALALNTTTCVLWCPFSETQPWFVYFDHQGSAATTITSATVLLRGQQTGTTVNPAVLQPTLPRTLNGDGYASLAIPIQRDALHADQYTGFLRVHTSSGITIAPIAFTLNVKHDVFWAFIAILFGIGVGRLIRFMQGPDVQRGLGLFNALAPVRTNAATLTAPPVRAAVEHQIAQLERRIDDPSVDNEALRTAILEWHSRTIILNDLQALQGHVQTLPKSEATRALNRIVGEKQQIVLTRTLDEAKTARDAVYTQYQAVMDEQPASKDSDNAKSMTATPLPTLAEPSQPTRWQRVNTWLRSRLEWLSGITSPGSAKARYHVYRPLIGLVFLLVLVIVGLQTKYAANPTFGAQWSNYWDIFLWGVTADVVNRALIGQLGGNQPA